MKRAESRIVPMCMGILVAMAIVCSQLFYFQNVTLQKKETKTEKHQQENSDDQVYFSAPSTSLPSPVHVELNPNVFFLFEILLEGSVSNTPDPVLAIPSGQFFRTIFGLIISPNAP
jgi:hypothetical protein